MDIHKPKAAHSIREFLIEIGTIICGILIALGLEQGVEAIRTHETVEALRAVLNRELSYDRARLELLRAPDACNARNIKELIGWTHSARLGEVHGDFWINRPAQHLSVWELARANPAFARMALNEQVAYAHIYDSLGVIQHFGLLETEGWRKIRGSLPFSGDPEVRHQLLPLLTASLGYQRGREALYDYTFKAFDDLHIKADYGDLGGVNFKGCEAGG
jgi:hypothetical protein